MSRNWSPGQEKALRECSRWLNSTDQVFYLAGYAGTGKSTLAQELVGSRNFLFATYTGKASHVLRQKGIPNAQTIHSLIYRPSGQSREADIRLLEARIAQIEATLLPFEPIPDDVQKKLDSLRGRLREARKDNELRFALWENSPLTEHDVEGVVIDECSMVDERIGRDLESFGKKILVIGDPAQLPPVGGGGYFTGRKPDVLLTEIHRHARDSGILRLATHVREGGDVRDFQSSPDCEIVFRGDRSKEEMAKIALGSDQTIVGRNKTRKATNRRHRELLGRTDPCPQAGDRLICLRNYRHLGMFNGSQFVVQESDNDLDAKAALMTLIDDDGSTIETEGWLHTYLGLDSELEAMSWERRDMVETDFGFAITCHKSQGSQWENVLVIDEGSTFGRDSRRWTYTAVTRAARKLTVLT